MNGKNLGILMKHGLSKADWEILPLSSKGNSSVGNEAFRKKKDLYNKSGFHFTKLLSNYENWDKSSIDDNND